jgi:cardiolipin synthase
LYKRITRTLGYLKRNSPFSDTGTPLPPYTPAESVRLLVDGNEILPAYLTAIRNATHSIRYQTMIFYADESGTQIVEGLCAAAQRGVRVRLMFGYFYGIDGPSPIPVTADQRQALRDQRTQLIARLRGSGVQVEDNLAIHRSNRTPQSPGAIALKADLERWVGVPINHVDHRKIMVIDDHVAFVGGANTAREYLYHAPDDPHPDSVQSAQRRATQGHPEAWEKWGDLAVQIEGAAVAVSVARGFDLHWELITGESEPLLTSVPSNGIPVQVLYQRVGYGEIAAAYFERIDQARESITVICPYINYAPALDRIVAAAQRGVKVDLIYPHERNDLPMMLPMLAQHFPRLIEAGVRIHAQRRRMIHAKAMVVDGRYAIVGSFNLNHRSFRLDCELCVCIQDEAFAAAFEARAVQPYLVGTEEILNAKPVRLTRRQAVMLTLT